MTNELDKNIDSKQPFEKSVSIFLKSIKERDFEVCKTYFDSNLDFYALLPGDRIFDAVESFMDSQVSCFLLHIGQLHRV